MLNKVTRTECADAVEYLDQMGFVDEMTSDKKYYTLILLRKVANSLGIKLQTNV